MSWLGRCHRRATSSCRTSCKDCDAMFARLHIFFQSGTFLTSISLCPLRVKDQWYYNLVCGHPPGRRHGQVLAAEATIRTRPNSEWGGCHRPDGNNGGGLEALADSVASNQFRHRCTNCDDAYSNVCRSDLRGTQIPIRLCHHTCF